MAALIRLRGSNPTLDARASSNLTFLLDGPTASLTLRRGIESNAPYLRLDRTTLGVSLHSGPSESTERLHLDGSGAYFHGSLGAARWEGLVDDFVTQDAFRPASANALFELHVSLSNQLAAGGSGPSPASGTLIDSYASLSTEAAPTANALRRSHATLCNLLTSRINLIGLLVDDLSRLPSSSSSASSSSNSGGSGSNASGGSGSNDVPDVPDVPAAPLPLPRLENNLALTSTPDGETRFRFDLAGASTFYAAGSRSEDSSEVRRAFGWFVNDLDRLVMELDGAGNLSVDGRVDVGGSLAVAGPSAAFSGSLSVSGTASLSGPVEIPAGELDVGGVRIAAGPPGGPGETRLGINLPVGVEPEYSLHVGGTIFADEGVYALSDPSSKRRVERVRGALDKVSRLRGVTYEYAHRPGRRRMGLMADEVEAVAPEAVSRAADGRLALAYDDLAAVLVEAIRELDDRTRPGGQYPADRRCRLASA